MHIPSLPGSWNVGLVGLAAVATIYGGTKPSPRPPEDTTAAIIIYRVGDDNMYSTRVLDVKKDELEAARNRLGSTGNLQTGNRQPETGNRKPEDAASTNFEFTIEGPL